MRKFPRLTGMIPSPNDQRPKMKTTDYLNEDRPAQMPAQHRKKKKKNGQKIRANGIIDDGWSQFGPKQWFVAQFDYVRFKQLENGLLKNRYY